MRTPSSRSSAAANSKRYLGKFLPSWSLGPIYRTMSRLFSSRFSTDARHLGSQEIGHNAVRHQPAIPRQGNPARVGVQQSGCRMPGDDFSEQWVRIEAGIPLKIGTLDAFDQPQLQHRRFAGPLEWVERFAVDGDIDSRPRAADVLGRIRHILPTLALKVT